MGHKRSTCLALSVLVAALLLASSALADDAPVPFKKGKHWGYKDASGKTVIAKIYEKALPFEGDLAFAKRDGGWLLLDKKGATVLVPYAEDDVPDPFKEGFARFVEAGKVGFYDAKGNKVLPAVYDDALPFQEGLAGICQGCLLPHQGKKKGNDWKKWKKAAKKHDKKSPGKWGFIDTKANVVVPITFQKVKSFVNGKATVTTGGVDVVLDAK